MFLPASTQILAFADSYSKAECVMELSTRRILHEENSTKQLPMASTTKILTCITAIQICASLEEKVEIPQEAVGIEGSSAYLQCGEHYSVRDLLYGLMLRSGNDCAIALALHCCKSIVAFATEMNKIAQSAGAVNSHFSNPHGLPQKQHYTTAQDLALIASFAMENAIFREIVSCPYYALKCWKNKNKILSLYKGADGIKTGYTKEAGRCLVSSATREGVTLICVVLSCPTTYARSMSLLDNAFSKLF
jgi:D-alanyl-D-alanine carboxypeptidase (penicillin-binding protein 5/6)